MEENISIKILLRTTEQQYKNQKGKPGYINNTNCLVNINNTKPLNSKLYIFGDRLTDRSKQLAKNISDHYTDITAKGNGESFWEVYEFAINNFGDSDVVYFLEDDYLHLQGWGKIALDGLKLAPYVSLYDHPDKYDGRSVQLAVGQHSHFQYAISTTMTFLTTARQLKKDKRIFERYASTGIPKDHQIFTVLNGIGTKLVTPIPTYATHGETAWLAPLIDWSKQIHE